MTGAITTPNAIPAGARTVAFNLTVADTVSAGHVAVVPGAGTTVTSPTVNWTTGGAIVANGGVVSLGSGVAAAPSVTVQQSAACRRCGLRHKRQ